MKQLLRRLRADERGATAIEYGMIISLVVIACVSAVQGVADETTGMWEFVKSTMVK